jgi:branched-chain amino acid transport system ATP-binding protein
MHEVARRGVVRTFQHSTLFAEMSVMENALVGTHMPFRPNIFAAIVGWDREDRRGAEARAGEALEFFGLDHLKSELAGELSHGHQRALGMAVAHDLEQVYERFRRLRERCSQMAKTMSGGEQ